MKNNMFKYIYTICIISTSLSLSSQTPPWYFSVTNCNQSNIVMDTAFKYSAIKADSGDYIGVFYDSSGTLACGGHAMFPATGNMSIAIMGDDPSTVAKDGFNNGESIVFKLWKYSNNSIHTLIPIWMTGASFDSTYSCNGFSGVTLFSSLLTKSQDIDLDKSISIYPNPNNNNIFFLNSVGVKSKIKALSVFNTSGKRFIYKNDLNNNLKYIDLSEYDLRPGHYIFEIITEKGSYLNKVIKY